MTQESQEHMFLILVWILDKELKRWEHDLMLLQPT
jgi:hypothetical protein